MQQTIVSVRQHEDFARVYNLPDPRSYYRALQPLDYRLPDITCGYLESHAAAIAAFRGKERLRLLDFACGYAPNGALLKHELSLAALYAFYAENTPMDAAGDPIALDRPFFAARRRDSTPFEVGGLDIADRALRYAQDCGLLDRAFAQDLTAAEPDADLRAFVAETDIVVETGGHAPMFAVSFAKLLDGDATPWFLYCLRGDVDDRPLNVMFAERGYRIEACSPAPFRYRKLMNERERARVVSAAQELGRDPNEHFRDGYFLNPLLLARPEADAADLPIAEIMLADS